MRAERDAVKSAGIPWWAYQSFMKKHEKPIEEEKLIRVPRTLDLTPYRDEKDFAPSAKAGPQRTLSKSLLTRLSSHGFKEENKC